MAGWVDSHGHLFMSDDPGTLLERAAQAGVRWVMIPGVDVDTSVAARGIAESYPEMAMWSAGLHPHEATAWPQQRDRIAQLAADAGAIGECGLDYYRDLSPRAIQREAFADQLELAAERRLPAIVHCRDAFADVHEALEQADLGAKAVLHCWTGGPKWTARFAELGVTFSFAGPVTFDTGDTVRRGAAVAPRERTMVETDAPYLTPPPNRRAINEPANVVRVGEALADVWGVSVATVAELTTAAATSVFGGPG